MEIIVGKSAGFCYGVKRAVENCEKEIKIANGKKVYCLGELVHNKQVIQKLENEGVLFIEDINSIEQPHVKLIIRAHGVPKSTYDIAKQKEIILEDFTCPNVLKIQRIADRYQKEGYYIFLTGSQNHPEVQGIISHCGEKYSIIENQEDLNVALTKLEKSNCNKLVLISQTTYSLERFRLIQEMLKENLKNDIELKVENTICLATEVRQKDTFELSKKVNKMIIIGGKNSSNTKKLFEIASENCKDTIGIETYVELENIDINKNDVIGIMAGASTPQSSIDDVVKYLEMNNELITK